VVEIRIEEPEDIPAIRNVHERAFGGINEAWVVDLLRNANQALISLVAVEDGQVVGHIMFSLITFAPARLDLNGVGLAPVGVLPEYQDKGIGSCLIREGLEGCKKASYDLVVVLGAPKYYHRFGFTRANDHGLENEYGVDEEFMVIELREGSLARISSIVKYSPLFNESGC